MRQRELTAMALRAGRPQRTARLRLTLWYGGLVSGAELVSRLVSAGASVALCSWPGGGLLRREAGMPQLCVL